MITGEAAVVCPLTGGSERMRALVCQPSRPGISQSMNTAW